MPDENDDKLISRAADPTEGRRNEDTQGGGPSNSEQSGGVGEEGIRADELEPPVGATAAGGVSGQWETDAPGAVGQGGWSDAGDVQNLPRPVDPVGAPPGDLDALDDGLAEDTARQSGDVGKGEAGPGTG